MESELRFWDTSLGNAGSCNSRLPKVNQTVNNRTKVVRSQEVVSQPASKTTLESSKLAV